METLPTKFVRLIAPCSLLSIFTIICYYTSYDSNYSTFNWRQCMDKQLDRYSVKQWDIISPSVQKCSANIALKPTAFNNKDETKYAYLSEDGEEAILVSVGIGNDTTAEEKFRSVQPQTKFYGADPITDYNEKLYTNIGEFFPFAVGGETKKSAASVRVLDGTYQTRSFFHLNIIVFIKFLVKHKYIDHLWLDAEGAEFEIFHMFHKNEDFDKENIVICQVNIETHCGNDDHKASFMNFTEQIVKEGKYKIIESSNPESRPHNRMFFVNVESEYCLKKFKFQ